MIQSTAEGNFNQPCIVAELQACQPHTIFLVAVSFLKLLLLLCLAAQLTALLLPCCCGIHRPPAGIAPAAASATAAVAAAGVATAVAGAAAGPPDPAIGTIPPIATAIVWLMMTNPTLHMCILTRYVPFYSCAHICLASCPCWRNAVPSSRKMPHSSIALHYVPRAPALSTHLS